MENTQHTQVVPVQPQAQPQSVTLDLSQFTNPDNIAGMAEKTGQFAGTVVQGVCRAGVGLFTGFIAGAFGNGRK